MSFDAKRLYNLLPAIYRIRDTEQGEPLKALLSALGGQIAVLEEDLQQLYDDQFIETCAEWVIPYIGDLIGYRLLHGVAPQVVSARAEVAHTIGFRRRKGTAAMLEQLARDVTGWHARVVEFFLLLATTQYMNHPRLDNWYAPDLRQREPLERLNTPFDSAAHTIDVRHIAREQGLYNIPNIGIFLWRLFPYSLTDSRAFRLDARRWFFNPLGLDTPLFTRPRRQPAAEVTQLAEPLDVPMPISRRVLDKYLSAYYGPDESLSLRVDGKEISAADVEVCDLSDIGGGKWAHSSPPKIAIDPVLGRIAFPPNQAPTDVLVVFHYGFSGDMGGGEYERRSSFDSLLQPIRFVRAPSSIQPVLDASKDGGAVELQDSQRYTESLSIAVNAGHRLEVRAANRNRPVLLRGGDTPTSGDLLISLGANAEVTLNGLLLRGHVLHVPAAPDKEPQHLRLRHCTLVPGLQPCLIVESANVTVEIDHCILGPMRIDELSQARITDSIIDATAETAIAYAAPAGAASTAGGSLSMERCTVLGKVHTRSLELASNSILLARLAKGDTWTAPIRSERKQAGCVRFSHVPLAAVVPRRFRCQPVAPQDALRVRPQFTSLRYGDPGYGQLSRRTAVEIRQGADDGAEMGAFHDLFEPQRETNLRIRLEEYLRFRLEAGIFYVT